MVCPNCGNANEDTNKFCFNCGTPIVNHRDKIISDSSQYSHRNNNAIDTLDKVTNPFIIFFSFAPVMSAAISFTITQINHGYEGMFLGVFVLTIIILAALFFFTPFLDSRLYAALKTLRWFQIYKHVFIIWFLRIVLYILINYLDYKIGYSMFEKYYSFTDFTISTILFFLLYGIYFYYVSIKTDKFILEIITSSLIFLLWFTVFKLLLIGHTYVYSQFFTLYISIIIHFLYFMLILFLIKNFSRIGEGTNKLFQSAHDRYSRSKSNIQ